MMALLGTFNEQINQAIKAVEIQTGKRPEYIRMNSMTQRWLHQELSKLSPTSSSIELTKYSGLTILIDSSLDDNIGIVM